MAGERIHRSRKSSFMRADSATAGPKDLADSNGSISSVPTRPPRPGDGFGELAPAALPACRLPQHHRVRDLYRVGIYHIIVFRPWQGGKCTNELFFRLTPPNRQNLTNRSAYSIINRPKPARAEGRKERCYIRRSAHRTLRRSSTGGGVRLPEGQPQP